jgi:nitrogen regulatory protein PII
MRGDKMFVLFIVLNEICCLEDILAGFIKEGIGGATIIDSQGMGRAIAHTRNEDIPMFGNLRMMLGDTHPYSKTIFTVLDSKKMVDKAVSVVKKIVSDCTCRGVGLMFTVPIGKVYTMDGEDK